MALILSLETATKNCSVALSNDDTIIAVREFAGEGYAHAEKLHVFIEEVVKEAGISFEGLSAVAVSMGPGSYTGLRIGVSAAKGLCYALNIPLVAVNTLKVIAAALRIESGLIVPMIDARRMEVYNAVYDKSLNEIRATTAEVITPESLSDLVGVVHLCGDGAFKCRDLLTDERFFYHDEIIYPSAIDLAPLAYEKFRQQVTEDVAYFEPFYLKDFIAGKPAAK